MTIKLNLSGACKLIEKLGKEVAFLANNFETVRVTALQRNRRANVLICRAAVAIEDGKPEEALEHVWAALDLNMATVEYLKSKSLAAK